MHRKYIGISTFLMLIATFFSVGLVIAHPPQEMILEYDSDLQTLNVTITHVVVDPDAIDHYIEAIEIYKNSDLYLTMNYTTQPTTDIFTYSFSVEAEAGDELSATAYCSLFGSISNSITISGEQGEPEIEIGKIQGTLFGVQAEIKNIGDAAASNVDWEISVTGGVLDMINKITRGTISNIPAEDSVTVECSQVIGFGEILIEVQAGRREDLRVDRNIKGMAYIVNIQVIPEYAVNLDTLADDFNSPVFLTHAGDGSNRLFVVDQIGLISIIDDGVVLDDPFLNLSEKLVSLMPGFDERGLLGLAFHPDYENNGRFFVYYSAPAENEMYNHTSIIAEYHVSLENQNRADPDSERIILTVDQPEFNHDAGQLEFGPNGYLFIGLGDGGGAGDQHGIIGNGQNISTLLGSILRIDVDSEQPYAIPNDNPFVGSMGRDEIYAYGFRNPWRFSYDDESDQFFVADVGQNKYEELNIMEKGENYGWRIMEGFHEFDPDLAEMLGIDISTLAEPIHEYSHGMGLSIVGGYVYHGETYPKLQNKYVFGEWSDGFSGRARLFYLEKTGDNDWTRFDFRLPENKEFIEKYILAFGEDEQGELYVLTTETLGPTGSTGEIHQINID